MCKPGSSSPSRALPHEPTRIPARELSLSVCCDKLCKGLATLYPTKTSLSLSCWILFVRSSVAVLEAMFQRRSSTGLGTRTHCFLQSLYALDSLISICHEKKLKAVFIRTGSNPCRMFDLRRCGEDILDCVTLLLDMDQSIRWSSFCG